MSINWLVVVPTDRGVEIPTYGNYGGPGYSDGHILAPGEVTPLTTPPIDQLDTYFQQHDTAYTSTDPNVRAEADLQLIRGIVSIPDTSLSSEGHLYAGAATLVFIDQITNVYQRPDLFAPGEREALVQNAVSNLQQGNVAPEPEEIAAVPQQLQNLLDYADIGEIEIGDNNSNVLQGEATNDILAGLGGNDILIGASGNDYMWGGDGIDTAQFSGLLREHTISGNSDLRSVSSSVDGNDFLNSVEVFQFVDGRLATDVSDPAAVVYRMYDAALDRNPDGLGFNSWIGALQSGETTVGLANSFIASAEFQATFGGLSNQQFVEHLYRNALNREGEEVGVTQWTNALDAGTLSRAQVLAGFSEAAEHIELLRPVVETGLWDQDETAASVARLYYAGLDRAPDAPGLTDWTSKVKGGVALADVADGFVFSSEFQSRYSGLSNQQFVEQLYLNALDRNGEAEGVAGWTALLDSGQMDRGDVLLGFSESPEHQIKTQPLFDGGIFIA
jgi:hypothetical protein